MYTTAFNDSTKGYCFEITVLQCLHLPFNNKYEIKGILSYHLRLWLHVGQCEPGHAILSPLGILYMHTFKKEPIISPYIKISSINSSSLIF